jgi:hypothetical protein
VFDFPATLQTPERRHKIIQNPGTVNPPFAHSLTGNDTFKKVNNSGIHAIAFSLAGKIAR